LCRLVSTERGLIPSAKGVVGGGQGSGATREEFFGSSLGPGSDGGFHNIRVGGVERIGGYILSTGRLQKGHRGRGTSKGRKCGRNGPRALNPPGHTHGRIGTRPPLPHSKGCYNTIRGRKQQKSGEARDGLRWDRGGRGKNSGYL